MKQLILDLSAQGAPSFDGFAGEENRELLYALRSGEEKNLYVWGAHGLGKTHLLQAWLAAAEQAGQRCLHIGADKQLLCRLPESDYDCVAVDDVHLCDEAQAAALFTLFNQWRDAGTRMLFTADVPPRALPLREDVRTRMGWCTVYEIRPLNDEEKMLAMHELARSRQMYADDDIYRYLLRHGSRDLPTLTATLIGFDNYALQQGRRMTLPLLKQFLQQDHS
ncbi:MAG: DnaA regulatory inactivator Hda [Neisseria sp.]|nr:DnaA regulatory inactivator Hda [Neisseria sp.]